MCLKVSPIFELAAILVMKRFPIIILCFILLWSCQTSVERQNPQKAKALYDEGMKITNDRIRIQDANPLKAIELNKKAIEKFSASSDADTSFKEAAMFASECTMYARDYQACIIWTSRWMRIDTSRSNVDFCIERINYCNEQLQLLKK